MSQNNNIPIGIFDSGTGGLTVVRSVNELLPEEDIIYFGDTARVPYGNKSRATVIRFAKEITRFLISRGVKLIVVACNTASSFSLAVLKKEFPLPVIGVIEPGLKEAVSLSKNRMLGVIGTNSTISSGAYRKQLARLDRSCRLFSKSCPLFVPLVENRFIDDPITVQVAERYLSGLKKKNIDPLILGCTHYPILKNVISRVMGDVRLVDSSRAVAREVSGLLETMRLKSGKKRRGSIRCYVSDDVRGFKRSSSLFLKKKVSVEKKVL